MALSLDTIVSAHATSGTTAQVNSTPGASANLLVAVVGLDDNTSNAPTGATYNGVAMTLLTSQTPAGGGTDYVSIYYMWNPPTGVSHQVQASWGVSSSGWGIWALTFNAAGNILGGTGNSANPGTSASCTGPGGPVSGDLQYGFLMSRFATITDTGSGQTDVSGSPMNGINGSIAAALSTIAGGTSPAFSWSGTNGAWAAVAFAVTNATPATAGVLLASAGEYDWVGAPASSDFAIYPVSGAFQFIGEASLILYDTPVRMTLVAPPLDYSGAALLAAIVQLRIAVGINSNPLTFTALAQQLTTLEREAIDHFMATYWCIASRILAQMPPIIVDKNAAIMLTAITTAQTQLAAAGSGPTASWYAQYVNQLQTQLVDYYMNTGAITAASILNTMTGVQSLPFNYISNYTFYQADIEG